MKLTWGEVKEFAAMPAGKQLVVVLFLGIMAVTAIAGPVIAYYVREEAKARAEARDCEMKRGEVSLQITRAANDTIRAILQRCEYDKMAFRDKIETELRERIAAVNDVLQETREVRATQRRSQERLRTITQKVSKILPNETP